MLRGGDIAIGNEYGDLVRIKRHIREIYLALKIY